VREDIVNLLKYMQGHHDRLDLDIQKAGKKRDWDNVRFYEGAQNATELFINLLNDIVDKHPVFEGQCPNCGEEVGENFECTDTDTEFQYWGCYNCKACINVDNNGYYQIVDDCI
jgi:hypothetical protein